jgi:hypothetical protein
MLVIHKNIAKNNGKNKPTSMDQNPPQEADNRLALQDGFVAF